MPNPSPVNAAWPQEKIDALREHWVSGIPASEIGEQMGITKNAVLGKVHKLKLTPRILGGPRSNIKKRADVAHGNKGQPKVNAIVASAARRKAPTPPEPFDMEDGDGVDVTALLGIMDLTEATCRWPHGDPLLPGFGYCGKHVGPKGPYCPTHTERAGFGYGRGPRP